MESSSSQLTTASEKALIAENVIDITLDHLPRDESSLNASSSSSISLHDDTDRFLLIQELKEISLKRKLAEIQNRFIRRKLTTYFKKKKINRAFIDGAKSDMAEHEVRYEDSLQAFIRTCEDESQITEALKNVENHQNEVLNYKNELQKEVSEYENALMETGLTLINDKTGENLSEKLIQGILTRQKKAREALSVQRLEFILAEKHANDTQRKLLELDDLGDGLCMADFEQLRTELQYLTDKIEERNSDLNRLRLKCEADTQKLANIREKRDVVLQIIDTKEIENVDFEKEQQQIRDELNKLRVDYGMLKKKLDQLNNDSGLLNRMPLLLDFDATVEKIQELKLENDVLHKILS
ncbi:coiled-coil domain-containing protein 96 [Culicoides brevitarsis]|uniref:coiled-coil domain-containing protein 96 n=1 Tax=Culicoides brevitarsis TaxID=469753 RepID=UPI00307CC4E1